MGTTVLSIPVVSSDHAWVRRISARALEITIGMNLPSGIVAQFSTRWYDSCGSVHVLPAVQGLVWDEPWGERTWNQYRVLPQLLWSQMKERHSLPTIFVVWKEWPMLGFATLGRTAGLVIQGHIKIIIIIIFIYCNWVVTRWQWLCYMYTKHEIGYL